jgi:hypothetical protein
MSDQKTQESHATAAAVANNVVVPFQAPSGSARKHEPPPTDEEIAEYRRIRPLLMQMLEQWPRLLKEHEAITSNCVLARKILSGDP